MVNLWFNWPRLQKLWGAKTFRKMRLTLYALILAFAQSYALSGYAQATKLNLKMENSSVREVLLEIENISEFRFLYNSKMVDVDRKVSVNFKEQTIDKALNKLFKNTGAAYRIIDRQVVLYAKSEPVLETAELQQQQRTVSGKVTDSSGQPLPGATIVLKGTTQGTVTNTDGEYSFSSLPENATLVFSFVGMKTQEVPVAGKTSINITMAEESIGIEEVVAIGYGTQKKVNLTGSVVAISNEEIERRQVGQSQMALQGIAPGVTVIQNSGKPGADGGSIRIRGIGTMGDSNPLILVDGVQTLSLNNTDPNMIESISILKDAAASSIYGSRAANGVILVTTKRAKENVFTVSYSHYSAWKQPTDLPDFVNAVDHMTIVNDALLNSGADRMYPQDVVDNYASLHQSDPYTYPDTDWQKETFTENGYTQSHFLNLTGGTDKVKIIAGLGYFNEGGIIVNTGFERITMRLNSDIAFSNKFSGRVDISLLNLKRNEPGSGAESVFRSNIINSAVEPFYIPGYGYGKTSTEDNSAAKAILSGYREYLTPQANINFGLKYKLLEDLHVDINYAPTYWINTSKIFRKKYDLYYADGGVGTGSDTSSLSESYSRSVTNEVRSTLNYHKNLNQHNLSILAGFEQEDYTNRWISAYRDNFQFPQYSVIDAGSSANQQTGGSGEDWALRSYFGRFNYNFNDRYLFEANIRYDGSSRFAEGKKWGAFPSFSTAWRLSEEEFWVPIIDVVNNFKLRASWGKLGNQNIGTYPFDSFLDPNRRLARNNQAIDGGALTSMPNRNISWESTEMANVGIDMNLFNHMSLTFDYYVKNTTDILLRLDVPKIIGLSAPYQNAGEVKNTGWDLGLKYFGGEQKDFKYDISFVLSDVKNEIIDLKGVKVDGLQVNFEGYAMNSFYGYEAIGYFQSEEDIANSPVQTFGRVIPGNIKYKDQDGDGVIDSNDRKIIGSPIPRYAYSLNTNLNWKNFDLGIFIQGVGKVNGYLWEAPVFPVQAGHGGTPMEMHKDIWSPKNPDANFPTNLFGSENNYIVSDFWMQDASYLRLKHLQLGYTLPRTLVDIFNIDRLRIYLSGENLLTLDNFWDGYDVEAPVSTGSYYPQLKTYSVGLSINF